MEMFGPEVWVGGPFLARMTEQAFGLLADEVEAEIPRAGFPNDAVD
jgi:hypothetical protein